MWYEKAYRRHLCDMHIDDWDEGFLSEFSPEQYLQNLKTAKIQSAMIYLQSHVGLCYYPTRSGRMHKAFIGREDTFRKLIDSCRASGISVTGYYSLIYNNYACDEHPDWRIVKPSDVGKTPDISEFRGSRYGLCCPNNPDYLAFTEAQIREIAEYVRVDAMFYDMLFWPSMCCCEHCRERYFRETGEQMPLVEDWNDERWLLHMRLRRRWMGEFASWVTSLTKELMPGVSVEHNVAFSALPDPKKANALEVINACDYVGGDLDRGVYGHSFTCKFYKSVSKNQPFEHMFTRCAPGLKAHTQIKSRDAMRSAFFLTAAHHGATLIIDAIDPVGTMDRRLYEQLGELFGEVERYENYFRGEMAEDIGIYYSLESKFSCREEPYTNYLGVTEALTTLISDHIPCGITGRFADLKRHRTVIAPMLTCEDAIDAERIAKYVEEGGTLYFSGADSEELLRIFFDAEVKGRTKETVVYIAPKEKVLSEFEYYNADYPMVFYGTAPIVEGVDENCVTANLTLPYTNRGEIRFASIHSDPPGIATSMPAMAAREYGKGRVIWSALPIECNTQYDHRRVLVNLIRGLSETAYTFSADVDDDVEITAFKTDSSVLLNAVLLNTRHTARRVADFEVTVHLPSLPKNLLRLPEREDVDFVYNSGSLKFMIKDFKIFDMYEIEL